jgi:capsular polysaccharide transport system permease protein
MEQANLAKDARTRKAPPYDDGMNESVQDGLVVTKLESAPPADVELREVNLRSRVERSFQRYPLELLLIGLPVLFAILYYGLYMSDQYISETQFVVRAATSKGESAFALMSQDKGLVRSDEDSFLVKEYLKSRDAVGLLVKQDGLLTALSRPEADFFNVWPGFINGNRREDLYKHFVNFIDVKTDSASGITTLKVRAFRPEDARRLSEGLMTHAENVINVINKRARDDAIRFAQTVAHEAEARVIAAQDRITEFRNREQILDPNLQATSISELNAKLLEERSSLLSMLQETQNATPDSPRIPALKNRLDVLEQQIAQQKSQIVGAEKSLVNKMSEYEKLTLKRDLAARGLTTALSSLEAARQDASRQQLYLERVVVSNLPDRSQYPQRIFTILLWFLVSVAAWWIVKSVIRVVMQHS